MQPSRVDTEERLEDVGQLVQEGRSSCVVAAAAVVEHALAEETSTGWSAEGHRSYAAGVVARTLGGTAVVRNTSLIRHVKLHVLAVELAFWYRRQ